MISFSPLTADFCDEIQNGLSEMPCGDSDTLEYAREVTDGFYQLASELPPEAVHACLADGFILVRIFDGERYVFPYPVDVAFLKDVSGVLIALSEYCRRQLIPLYISDVPREDIDVLSSVFPHIDADAYLSDEDSFFVRVNNELDVLEALPCAVGDRVELVPMGYEFATDYLRLCTHSEVNKFWSYDYRADMGESPTGEDFVRVALGEADAGIALSLAILCDREFIGEVQVYDFDYLGSAEIAIRLLPEYWGGGYADDAMRCAIGLLREMGVGSLRASVMEENARSVSFITRHFGEGALSGGVYKFRMDI